MKFMVIALITLVNYVPEHLCKRIIHGRQATIDEFPFQVSLEAFNVHSCGGSLLSDLIVITAAHCTAHLTVNPVGINPKELRVRVGASFANGRDGALYNISAVRVHPDHSSQPVKADLAILLLNQPVEMNFKTMPIQVSHRTPQPGEIAWVTGYGVTKITNVNKRQSGDGKSKERELRVVRIPIIPIDECHTKLAGFGAEVTEGMICAGYRKGHRDACKGDSGGPMVIGNELTGVVAWGLGCGLEGLPGVYSNINYYRTWIMQTASHLTQLYETLPPPVLLL